MVIRLVRFGYTFGSFWLHVWFTNTVRQEVRFMGQNLKNQSFQPLFFLPVNWFCRKGNDEENQHKDTRRAESIRLYDFPKILKCYGYFVHIPIRLRVLFGNP